MAERTLDTLELVGNALCLDFANTVNSRINPVHDYLTSERDLLRWAVHVGALADPAHGALTPIDRAWALRDAIYATFSAVAAGRRPGRADLAAVSDAYAQAMARSVLTAADSGYVLQWPRPIDPLWPIGRSAGELLTGADLDRIGECPGCGWLFLDTSRNGTRRWCSMATCGSRDKMARYHRRIARTRQSLRPTKGGRP
ncbi:MAG: ABATE domain-containing protein [Micromonosporaceae bacterium]|nr:ABATE domain-containing protein [Micromonosporaceae bacterium]